MAHEGRLGCVAATEHHLRDIEHASLLVQVEELFSLGFFDIPNVPSSLTDIERLERGHFFDGFLGYCLFTFRLYAFSEGREEQTLPDGVAIVRVGLVEGEDCALHVVRLTELELISKQDWVYLVDDLLCFIDWHLDRLLVSS